MSNTTNFELRKRSVPQNEAEIGLLSLIDDYTQDSSQSGVDHVLHTIPRQFFTFRQARRWLWAVFLVIFSLGAIFCLFLLLPHHMQVYALSQISNAHCGSNDIFIDTSCRSDDTHSATSIPNILHFVYILSDPSEGKFHFQFSQFMALYAAKLHWHPDIIYLHTNVNASSVVFDEAREGKLGRWTQQFFITPELTVNTVSAPSHAGNGQEIKFLEHKSDFVRVQAVHDIGGIYIDLDVHTLRNITALRHAGYQAIGGYQADNNLNSGTFMARKGSALTKLWLESMHKVYDGKWTTHSNDALTIIVNKLKNTPCEVLALPQTAFAPMGWRWYDKARLYDNYYESADIRITDGIKESHNKELPSFPEDAVRMNRHARYSWTPDWSCTYLLHAFSSKKLRDGFKDDGISPRSIASRQNNFALFVYPTLKAMFHDRIIETSDLLLQ